MAMSDFFAVMFTINMREAIQEEVKVEGIDPNSLNSLVQYAYTGKCLVCISWFSPHNNPASYNPQSYYFYSTSEKTEG